MILSFDKYQATGNDFILINNLDGQIQLSKEEINFICDRKFGIGSDGLILVESSSIADFNMNFYNPDASQSFCGNGSRSAVKFYERIRNEDEANVTFEAIDGLHRGNIDKNAQVTVTMSDTILPTKKNKLNGLFIDTGSPHYVEFIKNLDLNVVVEGRAIRNKEDLFGKRGTNVNFVEILEEGSVFVRTYERGVENETLSCGTGVTAAGLVYSFNNGVKGPIRVRTMGGELSVNFSENDNGYENITLTGPATKVFSGKIEL